MARVAVIGSRITRDLWSPDGADLLHVARSSLPSLMSPAPAGIASLSPAAPAPAGSKDALLEDLHKGALGRMIAFRPSYIVLDLFDERFDLLVAEGGVVTDSPELRASGYLDRAPLASARRVSRLAAACDRLWREAAREFAELIATTPLSAARMVLHVSRWPESVEVVEGQELDPVAHNAVLAGYEAELTALFPTMAVVNAPGSLRRADDGPGADTRPFRFAAPYDEAVRQQLRELGIAV